MRADQTKDWKVREDREDVKHLGYCSASPYCDSVDRGPKPHCLGMKWIDFCLVAGIFDSVLFCINRAEGFAK